MSMLEGHTIVFWRQLGFGLPLTQADRTRWVVSVTALLEAGGAMTGKCTVIPPLFLSFPQEN